MTLGSFFDGIGGWPLAAEHAGVTPLWASEIEPFPCEVTAHHFPEVLQLGDITKLHAEDIPPVDIVCAGSPCQDLSTAGKRGGLDGERSGLFRTAIRLVHAMRERTGKPRFFVWENVPGAFSSNKGNDFRAVLEEIGRAEIPLPPNGRWTRGGWLTCRSVKSRGECLTLNIGESPNEENVSSLSQILEKPTAVSEKYYLSARACKGILARAERREKTLPTELRIALERQSNMQ